MQGDFEGGNSAQRISEGRVFRRGHAGIGNDNGVTGQFGAIFFQESGEAAAADFFLAFDDEGNVARQVGAGLEICFDGFQVSEVLAFVIASATTKKRMALEARLERRRFPQFEWFRWLHIIMAIHHKMRALG